MRSPNWLKLKSYLVPGDVIFVRLIPQESLPGDVMKEVRGSVTPVGQPGLHSPIVTVATPLLIDLRPLPSFI